MANIRKNNKKKKTKTKTILPLFPFSLPHVLTFAEGSPLSFPLHVFAFAGLRREATMMGSEHGKIYSPGLTPRKGDSILWAL